MSIVLRPYQKQSVDEISKAFKTHKRIIFVLPTGGGKTICFSEMAFRAAHRNTKTLVLTDRIELFDQTAKAILKHNIPIVKIDAKNKNLLYTDAKLFVGMVETVKRRIEFIKSINPTLLILDEAHKSNFFKVMDALPNAYVIGATATPINKYLHNYYTHIVHVIDVPDLVNQNYLCKCIAYQMEDNFDDVKKDSTGEFETNSLYNHFNKSNLYDGVIEKYLEKCRGKKAVCFNVNIEHSEQTCKAFNAAGIKSKSLTSKTNAIERKKILEEFQRGDFLVLNNCGILTTGWDEPSVEAVIMNRATTSLVLFMQCLGRGSRPYPGKDAFIVLDFGMNHDRHGLWNQERIWDLDPPRKKNKKDGVAPIKSCKICSAVVPAQAKVCPYCKTQFEEKEKELKKGDLVEVTEKIPKHLKERRINDLNIDELIELEKTKLYKSNFIWRVIRSRGEEAIKEYASKRNFKSGWIYQQIKDIDKSAFNNFIIKEVTK